MHGSPMDDFLNRLHALEAELEAEIDRLLKEKRQLFRYTLERGRVRFENGMRVLHRHQREGLWAYLRTARLGHLLTAPVIYSLLIPFVALDIMVTLYQHICFRVYGISRVARMDYFVIDRHHLAYLNAIEKLNCVYCGYASGLIESPDPHRLVERFVDFGDADAYKARLRDLQKEIDAMEEINSHFPQDGPDG